MVSSASVFPEPTLATPPSLSRTSLATPRIVWGALLASTCVYAFVLFQLSTGSWGTSEAAPPSDLPAEWLAAIGLLMAPAAFVVRKSILGSLALGAPEATNEKDVASDEELMGALGTALPKYFTGMIIGLALSESVAVFGLVAAFLSQDPTLFLPGWALAALLMVLQFPRWQGVAHLLTPAQRAALYQREGLSLRP